ncbi:MAG: hypothetical protein SGI73_11285 [Chloroflexota bacterium]|nr:hypothetical protein [Chloroflexota bacterium]
MNSAREVQCLALIREQQGLIERLTARIEYLEAQLAKHSGNSKQAAEQRWAEKARPQEPA